MRLNIWNRILCAIAGVILILMSVAVILFGVGLVQVNPVLPAELWKRAVIIAAGALILALGVHCVSLLLRRTGMERGFVIQNTEYGDMSISMRALENMVQHCTDKHKNLSAQRIAIRRTRDGVAVDLKVQLQNGFSIPQVISSLQKEIKEYISSASGVPVSEVRVMVETKQLKKGKGKVLDLDVPAPAAETVNQTEQTETETAESVDTAVTETAAVSEIAEETAEESGEEINGETAEEAEADTDESDEQSEFVEQEEEAQ